MSTKTITLSIPIQMSEFLDKNPDLSPSKLIQSKINEIQEQRKLFDDSIFQERLNFLNKQINIRNNFIESQGLFPEFTNYVLEKKS